MTQHVGIVGCSSEGAALCYQTVCLEGARLMGGRSHPEVSMHTPSLSAYTACLENNDLEGVGELMLASANKLASIGADFLVCPDNTIHQALGYVESRSPLPWLHIAQVVASEARRRQFRRLGLVGTRWLVDSSVYPGKLAEHAIDVVRPPEDECDAVHRIIMDELVNGIFTADAVQVFGQVFTRLREQGCDAVVLGCTEIPLIMNDSNSPLPTLDSTRLLARAAVQRAME